MRPRISRLTSFSGLACLIVGLGLLAWPELVQAASADGYWTTEPLWTVIHNDNNLQLWRNFRDLVNWAMAAILIFTAFATILRINVDTYGVKKLLPAVLIGFVLANFSLFITDTIIQVSESLQRTPDVIVRQITGLSIMGIMWGDFALNIVIGVIVAAIGAFFVGPFAIIFGIIVFLILMFLPMIIIGILGLLFWLRHWVVQYLVVLAPLGLFALVLPFGKNIGQKWLNLFLTWVFMRPLAYFLLGFAAIVIESDVAGHIVSFIFGLSMMLAAITIPFKAGGYISATVGKVAGKLAVSGIKTGYTKAMENRNIRNNPWMQRLNAGIYGYQTLKAKAESSFRTASSHGVGAARTIIDTKEKIRATVQRDDQDNDASPAIKQAGRRSWFQNNEQAMRDLGVTEATYGRRVAEAQEFEALKKELGQDMESLVELTQSPDERHRAYALKMLGEIEGGLESWTGKISAYKKALKYRAGNLLHPADRVTDGMVRAEVDPLPGEAPAETERRRNEHLAEFQRGVPELRPEVAEAALRRIEAVTNANRGNRADDKVDIQNAQQMQRVLAAALADNRTQLAMLASHVGGGSQADILGNIRNNRFVLETMGEISGKLLNNGYMHLGNMVSKKIGQALGKVIHDEAARDRANIQQVFGQFEPQKIATMMQDATMVKRDASGEIEGLTDFGKKLASDPRFGATAAQTGRVRGGVKLAIALGVRETGARQGRNLADIVRNFDHDVPAPHTPTPLTDQQRSAIQEFATALKVT